MASDLHVYEELRNVCDNAPVWPGDTLSHVTAEECRRREWIARDADGNWVPTGRGRLERARLVEEARDG